MTNHRDLILHAKGICHVYHEGGTEHPVLHGVDLELRRSEFVIVMGPSGCGKTTLLNILGLMMLPTSGSVRIDGVETVDLSDAARTIQRRQKLGFVFQRFNLLPILSAEENVAMALRLRGEDVNGQASAVLDRVGLKHRRQSKPRALSVGEQQRVAIARAVVCRPSLLLADEPTGNLDSRNANEVLDLIADLNKTAGLTTLMITHNEQLADRADRVLHMRDGQFV